MPDSLAVYETRIEEHQSVIYRNNAADFQMGVADVEAVITRATAR
jgi:5-dehydro-2-deoxygluconokinase